VLSFGEGRDVSEKFGSQRAAVNWRCVDSYVVLMAFWNSKSHDDRRSGVHGWFVTMIPSSQ